MPNDTGTTWTTTGDRTSSRVVEEWLIKAMLNPILLPLCHDSKMADCNAVMGGVGVKPTIWLAAAYK